MRKVSTNLVHAQVLAPYERLLREENVLSERLFEGCGIPPEAIFDAGALITMRQAHHLTEVVARHTGEDTVGATVGRRLQLEELGATDPAIRHSASLFDARVAIGNVVQAAEPGSRFWMEQDEKRAWFCYRPERRFAGGVQSELFDLQCLLKFVRLAGGDEWTPEMIQVATRSRSVLRRVPEFSGTAIKRDDNTTAIAFSRKLLARPLAVASAKRGNNGASPEAVPQEEGDLSVATAVTLVLDSLASFEPIPSLMEMAERFGVTERTLQRALAECESSYRHLTERVLFRRAIKLLMNEGLPVSTISDELGYASPSSFIRAFRRIAGMSPFSYRKRNSRG